MSNRENIYTIRGPVGLKVNSKQKIRLLDSLFFFGMVLELVINSTNFFFVQKRAWLDIFNELTVVWNFICWLFLFFIILFYLIILK